MGTREAYRPLAVSTWIKRKAWPCLASRFKSDPMQYTKGAEMNLPADAARCNGTIYFEGKQICKVRDQCLRFTTPPVKDHPNQSWVFVCGSNQINNCTEFLPADGEK